MRARDLAFAIVTVGAVFGGASWASACDIVPATSEQQTAAWATYRAEAQAIFVGQVVALHPFSPAERRAAFPVRVLGSTYGDRAGMADIAPVEPLQGDAEPVRLRYSDRRVCDQDDWDPRTGDFVLIVRDREGVSRVFVADDIWDPALRTRLQTYAMTSGELGRRK